MASWTSQRNGTWSVDATIGSSPWSGGGNPSSGVPGNNDIVSIGHDVLVNDNRIIGSGYATDAVTITNATGARIHISGATLTCKGHLYLTGSNSDKLEVKLNQGGILEFDCIANNSPQFKYYSAGQPSLLTFSGISSNWCEIRTKAGSAGNNAIIYQFGGGGNPQIQINYCNLTRLGYGGAPGLDVQLGLDPAPSVNQSLLNIVGNQASIRIDAQYFGTSASGKWLALEDWAFISGSTTFSSAGLPVCASIYLGRADTATCSGMNLSRLRFDTNAALMTYNNGAHFATATDIIINGTWWTSTYYWGGAINRAFIADSYGENAYLGFYGGPNIFDSLYLLNMSAVANPHTATLHESGTIKNSVFDDLRTLNNTDLGDCIASAGGTYKNNIFLLTSSGLQTGQTSWNNTLNLGGSTTAKLTFEHNTVLSSGNAIGISFGETGPTGIVLGQIISIKNNIFESTTSADTIPGYALHGSTTYPSNSGFVNTSNANYNAFIVSGTIIQRYTAYASGNPGANDILAQSPNYVDRTRNFKKWTNTVRGYNTSNGNIDVSGAIRDIINTPSLLQSLLSWVKDGYRPQNLAYANGYNDGTTVDANNNAWYGSSPNIGAMSVYNVVSTSNRVKFINASFNNFIINTSNTVE